MCKIYVVMDALLIIPYYLLFFFMTKTFNFEILEVGDIIIKYLSTYMPNSLKINACDAYYYGEIRAMRD